MAINRFDSPVRYDYVSQYVPIPFLELLALGKAYNEEREKSEKQLAQYAKEVGDFNSRIAKDNQSYYDLTLGRNDIQSLIAEGANDPDKMKDFDYRQRLNRALLATDYGAIGKLKASKLGADDYFSIAKALAADGKLPPGWEEDYFNTYDTLAENKVFDKTPLAYQSVNDLIHPYVNDLKESFIGISGFDDITGVSEERTEKQVNKFKSDILNNPVSQRMMQRYMASNPNASEADALDWFMDQAYTAAHEKAWTKRTKNSGRYDAWKIQQVAKLKAAAEAEKSNDKVHTWNEYMQSGYDKNSKQTFNLAMQDPEFANKARALDKAAIDSYQNTVKSLFFGDKNKEIGGILNQYLSLLPANINLDSQIQIIDAFVNQYSNQISPLDLEAYSNARQLFKAATYANTKNAYDEIARNAFQDTFRQVMPDDPRKQSEWASKDFNPFIGGTKTSSGETYLTDNKMREAIHAATLVYITDPGSNTNRFIQDQIIGNKVIDTKKLMSSKQFLARNNPQIAKMAQDAGITDLSKIAMKRPKNIGFSFGSYGQNGFEIEDLAANGDFGKVKISEVTGYIDLGEKRLYQVSADIPYSAIEKYMDRWFMWDSPDNTLEKLGYTFSQQDDDHKGDIWKDGYVTIPLIYDAPTLPVENAHTDKEWEKYLSSPTSTKQGVQEFNDKLLDILLNE